MMWGPAPTWHHSTRELKFFENQNAEMWDHSSLKEGESDIAKGVWSYDAATKHYALTLPTFRQFEWHT
jgi:hypothetical protein